MKIEKISMTFLEWSNNFYISWSTFIPEQRQLQLRHYYADDCGVASSICCPPPQQGRGYARGKGEVARGGYGSECCYLLARCRLNLRLEVEARGSS